VPPPNGRYVELPLKYDPAAEKPRLGNAAEPMLETGVPEY
jgi:hypothetical protein